MDDRAPGADRQTLVIAGNGMTSHRLCQRLVACGATRGPLRVVVFGEEPRPAYDRVHLSALLAGRSEDAVALAPRDWYSRHGIELHVGDPVVEIDRDACVARSASDLVVPWDRLVLATGSRPFVPQVPGADLPGVLVYRTIEDARRIFDRASRARRAVIVGGGLLGLEAAGAALALGLEVEVIEQSTGLMSRQLDAHGAALLRDKIEALGVRVHLGRQLAAIEQRGGGLTIHLASGERLVAGMVVIAAGIRPRGEIAASAGLAVSSAGAVVVDDHLRTSDDRVFAVGECASHRGVTYGLAAPGYRMVDVVVDNLVGGDAAFDGADLTARLKLLGVSVASMGRPDQAGAPGASETVFFDGTTYRKLVTRGGRIVGAIAVGDRDDLEGFREALDEPAPVSFWDMRRFRSTGHLWSVSESRPVVEWAPDAVVCGCLRVPRGALGDAIARGCTSADELSVLTGAGTLCGACRPLLAELVATAPALDREGLLPPAEISPRSPILPESPAAGDAIRGPDTVRSAQEERAIVPAIVAAEPDPDEADEGPLSKPGHLIPRSPWADRRARSTVRSAGVSTASIAAARAPAFPAPVAEERIWPASGRRSLPASEPASAAQVAQPERIAPPELAAPPSEPAATSERPSATRLSSPPSSRRSTLPPLRPISIPPGPVSGRIAPQSTRVPTLTVAMPERAAKPLLAFSIAAAALVAVIALFGPIPFAPSIRGPRFDVGWATTAGKHATGWAVVGLSLVTVLLSLRKRWARFKVSDPAVLRAVHAGAGALGLAALALHTGLRAGRGASRLLLIDFLALAALGGVAGAVTACAHHLRPSLGRDLRRAWARAHLSLFWPLPVLVVVHVVAAYYY